MIRGTTYAPRQAKWLDLSPEETFEQILTWDMDILRLGCYWNEIEKEEGIYEFSEIEDLLNVCEKKNQRVILSIGMKAARWPEYYLPEWIDTSHPDVVEHLVLAFIKKCIIQLKHYSCITHWQVENEPLDPSGPNQWQISEKVLEKEITVVRSLDSRKIIITLWGNSLSKRGYVPIAQDMADIIGLDIYYRTPFWKQIYRGPADSEKSLKHLIKNCTKPVWVTELQAEPWERSGKDFRSDNPESISPQRMKNNIEKARVLGAEAILLWGCEYWIYQKRRGNSMYENIAREFFSQSKAQGLP